MRINVLGGTGYTGDAIVREAVRRGHDVVSYSRNAPLDPSASVEYVLGSLVDPTALAAAVNDVDAVVCAVSGRGSMAQSYPGLIESLIGLAVRNEVRIGLIGGVSSVLVREGGPRLYDVRPPADDIRAEVEVGMLALDALRVAPPDLDWFYVSPAMAYGAWEPQRVTGAYRVSADLLLEDDDGTSYIAAPDLALAVLDEIEKPQFHRRRFHVAL